jgi:hypothetical protein
MATDDHEATAADVPGDDEPIVNLEALLELEFHEEDEEEDDINMHHIEQEGIELQLLDS